MQFTLNAIRYEDVRQQVVEFLKSKGKYTAEFDYKGSNLAYIIDTMAYVTMLMSYQVSTIANDNFIDTTTLRKNAISIAKSMGYRPKRARAARLPGKFKYQGTATFNKSSRIIIPPKTIFPGIKNGQSFVNITPIVLSFDEKDPTSLSGSTTLYQGAFNEYRTFGGGASMQAFTIPNKFIDENNVSLFVKNTNEPDYSKMKWDVSKTFFDITRSKIYFVEEDIVNGYPKFIFGNGLIGQIPSTTETIIVEYLETIGAAGNGETGISIPTNLVPNKSFDISSIDLTKLTFETLSSSKSFGGKDAESIEEIRENAFSAVAEYYNIIGGDLLKPGDRDYLGDAYVTCIPPLDANISLIDNERIFLDTTEEDEILASMKNIGIIATRKFFLKPTYVYLDISPRIDISATLTQKEQDSIVTSARENAAKYFSENLMDFGVSYRASKIASAIEETNGVLSSKIFSDYYVVLNDNSFYNIKSAQMQLPVRFLKDPSGNYTKGVNGNKITTNFLKKNKNIIDQLNSGTIIDEISGNEIDVFGVKILNSALSYTFPDNKISATEKNKTVWYEGNKSCWVEIVDDDIFIKTSEGESFSIGTLSIVGDSINFTDTGDYVATLADAGISAAELKTLSTGKIVFVLTNDFKTTNLQPEQSSIYGKITHKNLNRALYNSDTLGAKILKFNVTKNINDEFELTTYKYNFFGEDGSLFYVYFEPTGNVLGPLETEYELKFKKGTLADKTTICTVIYTKPDGGLGEDIGDEIFTFGTPSADTLQFLADNGIVASFNEATGASVGESFIFVDIINSISSMKLWGKTKIAEFKYDGAAWSLPFLASFDEVPFANADSTNETVLSYIFPGEEDATDLLTITWDGPTYGASDYSVVINSTNTKSLRRLGLRENVVIEPFRKTDELGNTFTGVALYAFDVFHDSELGLFQYNLGTVNFNLNINGFYNDEEVAVTNIKSLFDNYSESENKVDILRIIPDNEYDSTTGNIIGVISDFDCRFNQVIRVNINEPTIVLV